MNSVVNFIVYGLITMARTGYSIVLLPSYETKYNPFDTNYIRSTSGLKKIIQYSRDLAKAGKSPPFSEGKKSL